MSSVRKIMVSIVATMGLSVTVAHAGPITDRINDGDSVRIGFAAEPPFAHPGDDGEALGFTNAIAIGVLESMGIDNIEPVVTDWGGLIPGMMANRLDIITGGMFILGSRCANVAFSEPVASVGDAFIVPEGNPNGLNDYGDVAEQGAVLATVVGHNTIEAARREGVEDGKIMQLPGVTELLAAVKAGRAGAGALPALSANRMALLNADTIDATDPADLPEWTLNWVGLGFRIADDDFRQAFNEALADYIGTPEMMEAAGAFEYVESNLPGDATTEWVCANR